MLLCCYVFYNLVVFLDQSPHISPQAITSSLYEPPPCAHFSVDYMSSLFFLPVVGGARKRKRSHTVHILHVGKVFGQNFLHPDNRVLYT